MNKKIIGMFVCTLMIAATVFSVEGTPNESNNKMMNADRSMDSDGNIQQVYLNNPMDNKLYDPKIFPEFGVKGIGIFSMSVRWSGFKIRNFNNERFNDQGATTYYNDECPRLAVDNDGDVHKVWMRESTTGYWEIWYAELAGCGPGFNVLPKQISDEGTYNTVYPSIALDQSDNSEIVWIDYRNTFSDIYYAEVRDNSGNEMQPNFPTDNLLSITGGNFYSGRAVGFPPVDGPIPDGHSAAYIEHPDIAVDSLNVIHVVWSDSRATVALHWEVFHRMSSMTHGISTTWGSEEQLTNIDYYDSICPVIDTSGTNYFVAWQDNKDGCWEIYCLGKTSAGGLLFPARIVSHYDSTTGEYVPQSNLVGSDHYNSACPDIGVDTGYIHIVFMDQRPSWYQGWSWIGSGTPIFTTIYDPSLNQNYWEVYKTNLEYTGQISTPALGGGLGIKRMSDMRSFGGFGKYTGPTLNYGDGGPDGYSMYPRIAVDKTLSPSSLTHITWHDDRADEVNSQWDIYYIPVQSWCENPTRNKNVSIYNNNILDMYPDIALEPTGSTASPLLAHVKWQSLRDNKWGIYENERKSGGDFMIADLNLSGKTVATYDLHPIDNNTYGFTFSLPSPGLYSYRIRAQDRDEVTYTTGTIPGPLVKQSFGYTADMMVGCKQSGSDYAVLGYRNIGDYSMPKWTQVDTWGIHNIIGSRDRASPCLADLDNDGDYDLLISNAINVPAMGYKNIGNIANPVWQRCTAWDVPSLGGYEQDVALADLDNDGDYDLVVGNEQGHKACFFENTGDRSSPIWTRRSNWDFTPGIEWPCPCFADLDNDGDYDLLFGSYNSSTCVAWENIGNAAHSVWERNSAWDLTGLPANFHKKPAFVDLNEDGKLDLMVGAGNFTHPENSAIWAYQNTGDVTHPVWTPNAAWDISLPGMTWVRPAFASLDGAHDIAIINLTTSQTTVKVGHPVRINITVINAGDNQETFNLNTYIDDNLIQMTPVTIESNTRTIITFTWDPKHTGTFTIKAVADPVPGETDTTYNTFIRAIKVSKISNISLLHCLQTHANMFSILQKLINRLGQ